MSEKKPIPKEIRATVPVWFTSDYHGPDDLTGTPERAIDAVSFYSTGIDPTTGELRRPAGWTLVGYADVVLRPLPERQLIDSKVEALRAQKAEVMAKAQAEVTDIDRKINTLLCLTFDQPTEVQP